MVADEGPRNWLLAAAVAGLAALLAVAAVLLHAGGGGPAVAVGAPAALGEPLDAPAAAASLVHVSGAVARPGLYRLSTGARVADAVAAAGGVTVEADPGRLPDLAAPVHDGRQVNVPFRRAGGAAGGSRLDLNTASVEELRGLPAMPEGLPEAIVESRAQWGPFAGVSELHTRLGVDAATVAALRPHLLVWR
jgi:competence protein ComEA